MPLTPLTPGNDGFDWFISDIHLDPKVTHIWQGFLAFLQARQQDTRRLYILGDLFDYWIGDDYHTSIFEEILTALKCLHSAGIQTFFCAGNRDFLVSDQFYALSGCQPLPDPYQLTLNGQPTLLLHGDSLCTQDTDYIAMRKTLRDPAWQQDFLSKPLSERLAIAQHLRERSQQETQIKTSDVLDANPSAVEHCFKEHKTQLMIHGHTHLPNRHALTVNDQLVERIVLGDWGRRGWALKSDHHGLTLLNWPIAQSI